MKLNIGQYGDYLGVFATIYNPSSDAAETPASTSVTFCNITNGVMTNIPALTTTLAQLNGVVGIWGTTVNVAAYSLVNMFVIVDAVVGGVHRTAIMPLGTTGQAQKISVGAPVITVTRGTDVQTAEGPAV